MRITTILLYSALCNLMIEYLVEGVPGTGSHGRHSGGGEAIFACTPPASVGRCGKCSSSKQCDSKELFCCPVGRRCILPGDSVSKVCPRPHLKCPFATGYCHIKETGRRVDLDGEWAAKTCT